jgi:hypothetical protein
MLYLFAVDTGTMMQLEMDLALETVSYLKGVIGRSCNIPPDKQVSAFVYRVFKVIVIGRFKVTGSLPNMMAAISVYVYVVTK